MKNKNERMLPISNENEIKMYFEKVHSLSESGEKFPVDFDEVWPLVYGYRSNAFKQLKKRFKENFDYISLQPFDNGSLIQLNITSKTNELQNDSPEVVDNKGSRRVGFGGDQRTENYKLSVNCLEFFIARKSREVFNVYSKIFHAVAKETKTFKQKRMEQYLKEGRDLAWIGERFEGIEVRKQLMSTVIDHEGDTAGIRDVSNSMYDGLSGRTAKELKEELAVPKNGSLRDELSAEMLAAVRLAELLAAKKINSENAKGNEECAGIAYGVGRAIGDATQTFLDTPMEQLKKQAEERRLLLKSRKDKKNQPPKKQLL